jgi:hypothetical protein
VIMTPLKLPHPSYHLLTAMALAGALSLFVHSTSSAAENAVLLEGFETSIDAATAASARVTLALKTSTGPEDRGVTQGTKSLEMTISETEGWGHDVDILFSDANSDLLRKAAQATNDTARYILRFDYVFPESGVTSWMNVQVGGWAKGDALESNNATNTMSIPLDLVTVPEEGPITLELNFNFDATEDPFTSLTGYIDNFRLVDTYAPGAKPVVYLLQSFEDPNDPTGGATDRGTRTTYSQYTSTGADDLRVSDGTHSLKVDYTVNSWMQDFTIPFAGTKLAEILKLDLPVEERPTPDQLARYTLRWETTYPAQADNTGGWIETGYDTQQQGFPWSQGGDFGAADSTGYQRTYSVTLDQTAWSDSTDPKPSLLFIANGDWTDPGIALYFDNFRLIDTGSVPAAQPKIESIALNAQKKIVITWTGGGVLQSTLSLKSPITWSTVNGATSGTPIDPPAGGITFYRVSAP